MDTLDALKTVIAVVETGSFTAASERLNCSKALVSKYINAIEKQLNIRLFNRTTRKILLTEAGSQYYRHALQLVEKYDCMIDDVLSEQSSPKGLLRVSAPVTFGENWLAQHIPEFCQLYPDLEFELVLNNHAVDMIEEGIDARIKVGEVQDSTMVARLISEVELIVFASPHYLERHGTPISPADLIEHQCVIDTNFQTTKTWQLYSAMGELTTYDVGAKVFCNSPQAIVNIVKAGGGIGFVTAHAALAEIYNNKLVQLFTDHQSPKVGLYVMYPHREYLPEKVRCFVEFMQKKFKNKCATSAI